MGKCAENRVELLGVSVNHRPAEMSGRIKIPMQDLDSAVKGLRITRDWPSQSHSPIRETNIFETIKITDIHNKENLKDVHMVCV